MKRWILALVTVVAVTLVSAQAASAQGFAHYGCGVPYGGGYNVGYGGYNVGYGGYAPGYGLYSPGYGYGVTVGYSGLNFSYGGYGGYGYHPATAGFYHGNLGCVPGHYHLHHPGHPHW